MFFVVAFLTEGSAACIHVRSKPTPGTHQTAVIFRQALGLNLDAPPQCFSQPQGVHDEPRVQPSG